MQTSIHECCDHSLILPVGSVSQDRAGPRCGSTREMRPRLNDSMLASSILACFATAANLVMDRRSR